tara:strand:+ start:1056 stop:1556 length:501 start_codon:yes stop_codon:yes gene_type:complete
MCNDTNIIKKTMELSSTKFQWNDSMDKTSLVLGVIAGAFDVIHPGYIKMFTEAANHCDKLFVCVHEDPSLERPMKLKPILPIEDRLEMISSLNQVYYTVPYKTEKELYVYLYENHFDIRFLGEDYKDKEFTGSDLNIPIHYIRRDHGWSTTKFKTLISESITRPLN